MGENWRMITFTLLLYELIPHIMTCISLVSSILTVAAKANFDSILAKYVNLVETLRFHQVENAYAVKRLVPVLSPQMSADIREMSWLLFSEGYQLLKLRLLRKRQSFIRLYITSRIRRR